MWRWWIFAGLVVMALGVVTMAVVSARTGGSEPIPCIEDKQVGEEDHSTFASRLDVEFKETVWLMMELTNTTNRKRTIGLRGSPLSGLLVTTPFCEEVWRSPPSFEMAEGSLDFEPGETHRFGGNWNVTDSWGEAIPPGDYIAYVSIRPGYLVELETGYPAPPEGGGRRLTVFKRIRMGEHHLRAVRPAHPPMPVGTPRCGGLVSGTYVRWVMEKRADVLEEWRGRSDVVGVLDANILDENSMPTGRRGIRVVVYRSPWRDPPERWTPDCLDGVPVQFVVRQEE